MRQHKLSERLYAVAARVPKGSRIADVGSDHAYVPLWLVSNGTVQRAIASDLNPGPLEKTAESLKRHGFSDIIELRLGYGLSTINPGETDVVIIAGMGGITISQILAASSPEGRLMILQPQTKQTVLLDFLKSGGYEILEESAVAQGRRNYTIITAKEPIICQSIQPKF